MCDFLALSNEISWRFFYNNLVYLHSGRNVDSFFTVFMKTYWAKSKVLSDLGLICRPCSRLKGILLFTAFFYIFMDKTNKTKELIKLKKPSGF